MKTKLYARIFIVKMKNGDRFKSSTQRLPEEDLVKFIQMFKKVDELNYFSFDSIYMNGQDISSIQIIKPWWARE